MDEAQYEEIYNALIDTLVELGQTWIIYQVERRVISAAVEADGVGSPRSVNLQQPLPISISPQDTLGENDQGLVPTSARERLDLLLRAIEHAGVTTATIGEEAFRAFQDMQVDSIVFESERDDGDTFNLNQQVVNERQQVAAQLKRAIDDLRSEIYGQ